MMLPRTFRSVKHTNPNPSKDSKPSSSLPNLSTKSQSQAQPSPNLKPKSRSWCVYLILSTNTPIKTYVGVTTDFSRRLKQHNGELKGGAKASRIGRPWKPEMAPTLAVIRINNKKKEEEELRKKTEELERKLKQSQERGANERLLVLRR
ncbi:hypothetical protein Dsin_010919 [Dipteronia sinensis]|uniref:GIY-YIG domain-containing protein n=1 Tax=Dipteronia sinensis TaxID=43782 RepID=A0AAE0AUL6_9ROSI|nr:hypothetical protein Dsin_010919 [Dipteronia sinensis]